MAERRVVVHADEACLGNGQDPPTPGGCGGLVEIGVRSDGPTSARVGTVGHGPTDGPRAAVGGGTQGELWTAPAPVLERRTAGVPAGAVERFDYFLSEPDTTNNRMALRSAIAALELAAPLGAAGLTFVTDSNYIVLGMSKWVSAWRARGWRRKGGPIENLDLWQALEAHRESYERATGRPIEWRWVKGHAGHAKNEYANHLATRAAADQGASGGLAPSGFSVWLERERARGRYVRFDPDGDLR